MHRPPPPKHWNGSHHPKHNFKNGSHRPPKHGFKVGNNRSPMQHSGRGRR